MARFTHPAISSGGASDDGSWQIEGGTTGEDAVQPTFAGNPLFSGHYEVVDKICTFAIEVDMFNITDFGEGQYFMKLPFATHHPLLLANGCLHDSSGDDQYAILGHVEAGSDIMTLQSIGSNGRHIAFNNNTPIGLDVADTFHIAGTYEILH